MRRWVEGAAVVIAVAAAAACGGEESTSASPDTATAASTTTATSTSAPTLTPTEINQLAATATAGEWLELDGQTQLAIAERWVAVEKSELTGAEVLGAGVIEASISDPSTPIREVFANVQATLLGTTGDAEPDVKYTHTCDYILGDFTESATGYRFVADVELENQGGAGAVNRVTAIWRQIGTDPIKVTKTVRVRAGGTERVGFTRVASQEEIDLHQAADAECEARVSTVDVFTP